MGRICFSDWGDDDKMHVGLVINHESRKHRCSTCATVWYKQCGVTGSRVALLVPSNGTLLDKSPAG